MRKLLFMLALAVSFMSCGSDHPYLKVVDHVDIDRYMGTWYEIAKLPNSFEEGLDCITATYTRKENGDVKVLNRGHSTTDHTEIDEANGTAWVVDPATTAKLKVRFFWPFAGDYWILALDKDYRHVLIGTPSRKYLWILSRTPALDESTMRMLLDSASRSGFDVSKVERVPQTCNLKTN